MATKRKQSKRAAKRPVRRKAPRAARPHRKEPQSLRFRECSASFTVNDLEQSLAWYRDVLGFTIGERWEENGTVMGVQLKAGAVDLMLNQDDFSKGRDRAKGVGFHLWCSTAQDVDHLAAEIKARGGRLAYEPRDLPWGDRAFGVTDPDGFQVTVVQAGYRD